MSKSTEFPLSNWYTFDRNFLDLLIECITVRYGRIRDNTNEYDMGSTGWGLPINEFLSKWADF